MEYGSSLVYVYSDSEDEYVSDNELEEGMWLRLVGVRKDAAAEKGKRVCLIWEHAEPLRDCKRCSNYAQCSSIEMTKFKLSSAKRRCSLVEIHVAIKGKLSLFIYSCSSGEEDLAASPPTSAVQPSPLRKKPPRPLRRRSNDSFSTGSGKGCTEYSPCIVSLIIVPNNVKILEQIQTLRIMIWTLL